MRDAHLRLARQPRRDHLPGPLVQPSLDILLQFSVVIGVHGQDWHDWIAQQRLAGSRPPSVEALQESIMIKSTVAAKYRLCAQKGEFVFIAEKLCHALLSSSTPDLGVSSKGRLNLGLAWRLPAGSRGGSRHVSAECRG